MHVRLRSLDCFQMCALSSLPLSLSLSLSSLPSPLCFHLPPASTSLRTLLDNLLPSTSCVSPALGATYPLSHVRCIYDKDRNSFVGLDRSKRAHASSKDCRQHVGCLWVVVCLAEMKFPLKVRVRVNCPGTGFTPNPNPIPTLTLTNLSECLHRASCFDVR